MAEGPKGGYSADQLREIAILVALRTGLLKKCPIHNEIYDPGQHDYQGASMVAAYLVNQSDPLVAAFKGDRTPLTDLLKIICKTHPTSCPQCDLPKNGHAEESSQPKPALSPK
jgi:hypothetical protein